MCELYAVSCVRGRAHPCPVRESLLTYLEFFLLWRSLIDVRHHRSNDIAQIPGTPVSPVISTNWNNYVPCFLRRII